MKCSNGSHSHNSYLGFFSFFHRSKKRWQNVYNHTFTLTYFFLSLFLTTQQELFTADYHYRLRFLWNLPNESYSFLNESLMGTSINDFLKEIFCISSFCPGLWNFQDCGFFTQRSRWTCPIIIIIKSADNYKSDRDLK